MSKQIDRHELAAWLRRNGFVEKTGQGHRHFTHPTSGIKVTLPDHGRAELTRGVVGNVVRSLVRAGYDRDAVRAELEAIS